MRPSPLGHILFALFALLAAASAARKPVNSVLLSNVKALTLRKGQKTAHRRVAAIPQLKCIGGNARAHYEIDVLRCTNAGSDYDDASVQWTCRASLPPEFKLGSTDVICEGYDSPEDPFVLKGSCGVEYRLMLTKEGEEKYGNKGGWGFTGKEGPEESSSFITTIFWVLFIGVALRMLYSAFFGERAEPGVTAARRPRTRRGPGWGSGGGGGGDDDDAPPPYDWRPGGAPPRKPAAKSGTRASTASEGWRPGFWSGAAGGAAAGYMAGRMGSGSRENQQGPAYGQAGGSNWFGRSRQAGGSGSAGSSSEAPSSARYESTGFGETRRR